MAEASGTQLSRRARRIEEVALEVPGVTSVRVWELSDRIEIGVQITQVESALDILKLVEDATDSLREPDEKWSIGLLAGVAHATLFFLSFTTKHAPHSFWN